MTNLYSRRTLTSLHRNRQTVIVKGSAASHHVLIRERRHHFKIIWYVWFRASPGYSYILDSLLVLTLTYAQTDTDESLGLRMST